MLSHVSDKYVNCDNISDMALINFFHKNNDMPLQSYRAYYMRRI
jgi:hypothetical protein